MEDGMLKYHPGMIGDYTHSLMTYSSELDNIASQAQNILAGLHEYFDTQHGSTAYTQVQQMINDGIQEGRDVIQRHGNAVDTSLANFVSQDHSAGNSFMSI
ncbi:hypothetical protein [Mycobacterium branderi]|uniref:ESAT-6-like protein EsxC n=1 Tax=Mycobacterium branderi TaxID=43348 RepID=A0A7I7WEI0_9MYCO|nr:hypothetical protein [Mycobacterium branderi]MCV7235250.1 hypothetical protein [Mycobacterium branderi]ORA29851.1 hypothetical protein BST20_27740 [Mycobacterium branderi]BBZ15021.1 hypothetical protein MBRA_52160 [Mycobacterium branderi]